jgi:hypothetical protein
MTENEAREKWCPIKWRDILTDGCRTMQGSDAGCSGGSCMMWRWLPDKYGNKTKTSGYCGLGGKP